MDDGGRTPVKRDADRIASRAVSDAAPKRLPMRVLLLHNRYRAEGGEERAVADIAGLLRRRGHLVEVLERSSEQLGNLPAARALLSGGVDPQQVGDAVRRLRADVVHAHNLHPLFGWRALAAASAAGARTVLHLHNFRLFCAVAIGYRDGAPCFRCRGIDTRPGLRLRCRGSLTEAAVYAAGLTCQQPRLFVHADRFITVSDATARRLVELGLPAGPTASLPNFVSDARVAPHTRADRGEYALVSGRLVEEKGVDTAIAAARNAGVPLVVAGDGPDAGRLRALAGRAEVRFTGRLDHRALGDVRARAGVVLVPSRWEEPWPYAALDACAAGVPVLASDRGGLPELVGREAVLAPDDVPAWSAALDQLWRSPATRRERGASLLGRAREQFGENRYYKGLMDVYEA
jgi:glycosyltransferase involved in cell wall biosynthesis